VPESSVVEALERGLLLSAADAKLDDGAGAEPEAVAEPAGEDASGNDDVER
jgi:hypothetical protein